MKNKSLITLFTACLLLAHVKSSSAAAAPPDLMSFQSYLTDDSGNPVGSASAVNKRMTFTIYNNATGGTAVWAEEQIVTVNNGHFSVVLGSGSAVSGVNHDLSDTFAAATENERHIEMVVADADGSNPQTITPRMRLLPTAYAFIAQMAIQAESLSVPTSNLADSSVDSSKLTANAVLADNLASGSVTTAKIADANVTTAKIQAAGVTTGKLAANAVTSAKIADGAVASADLANDSVTEAKIAADAVRSAEIQADAVGSSEIAANAVGAGELANNAVDTGAIQDDAVTAAKIPAIFLARRYTATNVESQTWDTGVSASGYYPVLMSYEFGVGNLEANNNDPLWGVFFTKFGGNWVLNFQGITDGGNHPDPDIRVMFIPAGMVSSNFTW